MGETLPKKAVEAPKSLSRFQVDKKMKSCLLLLAALIALSVGAKLPNREAGHETDTDTDDEPEPTPEPDRLVTPKSFEDGLKIAGHEDFIDTKCFSLFMQCWLDKAGTKEGVPVLEAYNYVDQCCVEYKFPNACGNEEENPMCHL